jgi:hypothetical protein
MYARVQQKEIADYIDQNGKKGDRVTLIATGSFPIMAHLENKKICKFTQSQFTLGIYTHKRWLNELRSCAGTSNWLVIQTNDRHPAILGHGMTSWQALRERKPLFKYIRRYFDQVYETNNYYLFKRTTYHDSN